MRIISGKYRGKLLKSPDDDRVRPTTDMVKEGVFNIIQFRIADSNVLDLFAGSGAIGAEMLSRGALKVYAVDCDKNSIATIKNNLSMFDHGDYEIINADYRQALTVLQGKQFDIIYLDPPYHMLIIDEVLALIDQYDLLMESGIVIYESLTKTNQKSDAKAFRLIKSRRYGTVTIDIYERDCVS